MKLFLNTKVFSSLARERKKNFFPLVRLENKKGFSLLEVLVATAIFLLFALGIYGSIHLVFKIVYMSRLRILETALLSEQLEVARNLSYDNVGIINGVPSGVLPHTTSTVRNGMQFNLITTVRNIDDPFDGTAAGTPRDTSPADYKLVEISAICNNCEQQTPVILSTMVAPKNLEGASVNGSLFITVFDANGLPVAGANVDVTNTSRSPNTIISDTTNNDGLVAIVDTPTGTISYNIRVSKAGYSSDYTVSSSVSVPNPVKPPSTVASQTVTELSFGIDQLSSINLNTVDTNCAVLANQAFSIWGEKIIGTNPTVYKYSKNLTTNGSGNYNFGSMEWDKYHVTVSGAQDIAGSIPMIPLNLTPGLSQNFTLILKAHATNSLLVQVKDAGTGLPLSNATVHLYIPSGYDETVLTGYGYTRQTDWSGGSGQAAIGNDAKYFADNGNLNVISPAGDLILKKVGSKYLNSGWLESSTFDLGSAVNFNNILFEPLAQATSTGINPITFQIATSNSSSPASWTYRGPDGATSTYYTATSSQIYSGDDNHRYLRYKVFLNTTNTSFTPHLFEVAFTFTNGCTPPGQVFFSNLSAATYNLDISHDGYTASNNTLDVTSTQAIVNLSP